LSLSLDGTRTSHYSCVRLSTRWSGQCK